MPITQTFARVTYKQNLELKPIPYHITYLCVFLNQNNLRNRYLDVINRLGYKLFYDLLTDVT